MNEITYILGAGASCQAMPLVKGFNKRFDIFQKYLEDSGFRMPNNLIQEVSSFSTAIKSHYSFDTFFKKMFHKSNTDDEIIMYKRVLLYYFLFEHLVDYKYLEFGSNVKELIAEYKIQKTLIDQRYEALIAGLLKPIRGKAEFHRNINLFNWNYDINLITALRNFISPNESITDFQNRTFKNGYFQINEQVKLFHLNGYVTHSTLNEYLQDVSINSFNRGLSEYNSEESMISSSRILFSWNKKICHILSIRIR